MVLARFCRGGEALSDLTGPSVFFNCSRPFHRSGLALGGLSYAAGIPTSLASLSISTSIQLDAHPNPQTNVPSNNEGTRERQDARGEHISPMPSPAWHLLELVVMPSSLRLELVHLEQK